MSLLSFADPVFVVDLTPGTMARCRSDFFPLPPPAAPASDPPPRVPHKLEQPIGAIALLFGDHHDPVLLAIAPTTDGHMLDATARLLRAALLTHRSITDLITEYGDDSLKRLYFAKHLPTFFYEGLPEAAQRQVPPQLLRALSRRNPRTL